MLRLLSAFNNSAEVRSICVDCFIVLWLLEYTHKFRYSVIALFHGDEPTGRLTSLIEITGIQAIRSDSSTSSISNPVAAFRLSHL